MDSIVTFKKKQKKHSYLYKEKDIEHNNRMWNYCYIFLKRLKNPISNKLIFYKYIHHDGNYMD